MKRTNIEIKARCSSHDEARQVLQSYNAEFRGTDHQVDTYFNVNNGRLKLREGNIENFLIHYVRPDQDGPKQSDVILYKSTSGSSLKSILKKSLGILVEVDKLREIYFIGNVKFHLDNVKELGSFIEIEAIDSDGSISTEELHAQCSKYKLLLNISESDLISDSYSDILLRNRKTY